MITGKCLDLENLNSPKLKIVENVSAKRKRKTTNAIVSFSQSLPTKVLLNLYRNTDKTS